MADQNLETAKLVIKGILADNPEERAKVDAALVDLRRRLNEEAGELKGVIAFLLFADYADEMGL